MVMAVSRVGDQGSHGGSYVGNITSGNSSVKTNDSATAIVGSGYNCSAHGPNEIVSSPATTKIAGVVIATVGSACACGAVITHGSPNVNSG